jgi:hypothetical protein
MAAVLMCGKDVQCVVKMSTAAVNTSLPHTHVEDVTVSNLTSEYVLGFISLIGLLVYWSIAQPLYTAVNREL